MLFHATGLEPKPFRHIVFHGGIFRSRAALLRHTLQLAEKENCERLYVIRNYQLRQGACRAAGQRAAKGQRAPWKRRKWHQNSFLRPAPLRFRSSRVAFAETRASRKVNFVQAVEASLLDQFHLETEAPGTETQTAEPRIAWVTDVIPCESLWMVR